MECTTSLSLDTQDVEVKQLQKAQKSFRFLTARDKLSQWGKNIDQNIFFSDLHQILWKGLGCEEFTYDINSD